MNLMRPIYRLFSAIEKESTPRDWAIGLSLGVWLGWQFGLNLQTFLGILSVALIRGNCVGLTLGLGVGLVLQDLTMTWCAELGFWVLTHGASYRRVWAGLYHAPLVPFTYFYDSQVMGRLLLGTAVATVVYWAVKSILPLCQQTLWLKILDGPIGYSWQHSTLRHRYLVFISQYGHPPASHTLIRTRAALFMMVAVALTTLPLIALSPLFLKSAVSRFLTIVNGAPVTVGSLDISWFKGELQLKDIAVTHHVQPSRNLLQIDSLVTSFDLIPLLKKKILLERVDIEGIQYDLPKKTWDPEPLADTSFTKVPSLMDRVAAQFFTDARKAVKENPFRFLVALQKGMDMTSILRQERGGLKSEKDLSLLVTEVETLRSQCNGSPLGAALTSKCQTTWAELNGRFIGIDRSVASDVEHLKDQLGFSPITQKDLSRVLLGPRILQWVERLGYWMDFSRRRMGKSLDSRVYTMVVEEGSRGKLVHFGKRSTSPALLVTEVRIHSQHRPNTSYGNVEGFLRGITNAPAVYGLPFEAEVQFEFPEAHYKKTKVSAKIDHTAAVNKETFTLDSESFPLNPWAFYQTVDLYLGIKKAQMSFHLSFDALENSINAKGKAEVAPLQYEVRSPYKQLQAQLESVFTRQNQIPIEFELAGLPEEASLTIKSQFGVNIADALRNEFRQTQMAVEENLKREIDDSLASSRRALESRLQHSFASFLEVSRKTASIK